MGGKGGNLISNLSPLALPLLDDIPLKEGNGLLPPEADAPGVIRLPPDDAVEIENCDERPGEGERRCLGGTVEARVLAR